MAPGCNSDWFLWWPFSFVSVCPQLMGAYNWNYARCGKNTWGLQSPRRPTPHEWPPALGVAHYHSTAWQDHRASAAHSVPRVGWGWVEHMESISAEQHNRQAHTHTRKDRQTDRQTDRHAGSILLWDGRWIQASGWQGHSASSCGKTGERRWDDFGPLTWWQNKELSFFKPFWVFWCGYFETTVVIFKVWVKC